MKLRIFFILFLFPLFLNSEEKKDDKHSASVQKSETQKKISCDVKGPTQLNDEVPAAYKDMPASIDGYGSDPNYEDPMSVKARIEALSAKYFNFDPTKQNSNAVAGNGSNPKDELLNLMDKYDAESCFKKYPLFVLCPLLQGTAYLNDKNQVVVHAAQFDLVSSPYNDGSYRYWTVMDKKGGRLGFAADIDPVDGIIDEVKLIRPMRIQTEVSEKKVLGMSVQTAKDNRVTGGMIAQYPLNASMKEKLPTGIRERCGLANEKSSFQPKDLVSIALSDPKYKRLRADQKAIEKYDASFMNKMFQYNDGMLKEYEAGFATAGRVAKEIPEGAAHLILGLAHFAKNPKPYFESMNAFMVKMQEPERLAFEECLKANPNDPAAFYECINKKSLQRGAANLKKVVGFIGEKSKECLGMKGETFDAEEFRTCMFRIAAVAGTAILGGEVAEVGGVTAAGSSNALVKTAGHVTKFFGEWIIDQTGLGGGGRTLPRLKGALEGLETPIREVANSLKLSAAEEKLLQKHLQELARYRVNPNGKPPVLPQELRGKNLEAHLQEWDKTISAAATEPKQVPTRSIASTPAQWESTLKEAGLNPEKARLVSNMSRDDIIKSIRERVEKFSPNKAELEARFGDFSKLTDDELRTIEGAHYLGQPPYDAKAIAGKARLLASRFQDAADRRLLIEGHVCGEGAVMERPLTGRADKEMFRTGTDAKAEPVKPAPKVAAKKENTFHFEPYPKENRIPGLEWKLTPAEEAASEAEFQRLLVVNKEAKEARARLRQEWEAAHANSNLSPAELEQLKKKDFAAIDDQNPVRGLEPRPTLAGPAAEALIKRRLIGKTPESVGKRIAELTEIQNKYGVELDRISSKIDLQSRRLQNLNASHASTRLDKSKLEKNIAELRAQYKDLLEEQAKIPAEASQLRVDLELMKARDENWAIDEWYVFDGKDKWRMNESVYGKGEFWDDQPCFAFRTRAKPLYGEKPVTVIRGVGPSQGPLSDYLSPVTANFNTPLDAVRTAAVPYGEITKNSFELFVRLELPPKSFSWLGGNSPLHMTDSLKPEVRVPGVAGERDFVYSEYVTMQGGDAQYHYPQNTAEFPNMANTRRLSGEDVVGMSAGTDGPALKYHKRAVDAKNNNVFDSENYSMALRFSREQARQLDKYAKGISGIMEKQRALARPEIEKKFAEQYAKLMKENPKKAKEFLDKKLEEEMFVRVPHLQFQERTALTEAAAAARRVDRLEFEIGWVPEPEHYAKKYSRPWESVYRDGKLVQEGNDVLYQKELETLKARYAQSKKPYILDQIASTEATIKELKGLRENIRQMYYEFFSRQEPHNDPIEYYTKHQKPPELTDQQIEAEVAAWRKEMFKKNVFDRERDLAGQK